MSNRFALKPAHEMVDGETWLYWTYSGTIDPEDAATRTPQAWPPKWRWSPSTDIVIDTEDAWHRAHASTEKVSPRYVVKKASEMVEGEPYVNGWLDGDVYAAEQASVRYNKGARIQHAPFKWPSRNGSTVVVVDTHSPEWLAFQRDHRRAVEEFNVTGARPAPPHPPAPSDAAICEAWRKVQHVRERGGKASTYHHYEMDRAHAVTAVWVTETFKASEDDYRRAWSRELKRLTAEAEHKRRLPIQIDTPEDHEAPDAPSVLGDWAERMMPRELR